jgi:hypothetical protein
MVSSIDECARFEHAGDVARERGRDAACRHVCAEDDVRGAAVQFCEARARRRWRCGAVCVDAHSVAFRVQDAGRRRAVDVVDTHLERGAANDVGQRRSDDRVVATATAVVVVERERRRRKRWQQSVVVGVAIADGAATCDAYGALDVARRFAREREADRVAATRHVATRATRHDAKQQQQQHRWCGDAGATAAATAAASVVATRRQHSPHRCCVVDGVVVACALTARHATIAALTLTTTAIIVAVAAAAASSSSPSSCSVEIPSLKVAPRAIAAGEIASNTFGALSVAREAESVDGDDVDSDGDVVVVDRGDREHVGGRCVVANAVAGEAVARRAAAHATRARGALSVRNRAAQGESRTRAPAAAGNRTHAARTTDRQRVASQPAARCHARDAAATPAHDDADAAGDERYERQRSIRRWRRCDVDDDRRGLRPGAERRRRAHCGGHAVALGAQ